MSYTVVIPVRTRSESNLREHWAARAQRARMQRGAAALLTRQLTEREHLYCCVDSRWTITLTRIAPRAMDSDNLARAIKHVRDGVADALRVDDGDPRLEWRYSQERGGAKEYAVRVEIESNTSTTGASGQCGGENQQ